MNIQPNSRSAANAGHLEALTNLGLFYDRGEVRKNSRKAFTFYKRAAELGDPVGQRKVGIGYIEGLGTKRDPTRGMNWFRKAARKGDLEAQYILGSLYIDDENTKPNKTVARLWLDKAAKRGHKRAKTALKTLD
jgi:TPR repeat protein